uniref:Endonuclease/exonuclease/phosphatase domain-containing protein n=1 Tax=Meloidogyne incognita TaxID=6306 RepID=A0A914MRT6_MELIC
MKYISSILNPNVLIYGDFNIPKINWDSMYTNNELGQLLIDFCSQNEIHQHIKENTRDASILDLVFTKPKNLIENYNISAPFSTSDHNMISFILNVKFHRELKSKKYIRSFSQKTQKILKNTYHP